VRHVTGVPRASTPEVPRVRLLTLARDLARRRARERQGLFVCEGVRAVEELLRSPLAVRGALALGAQAAAPRTAALIATMAERGIEVAHVDEREFASAADTDSPQGILAIAEIPRRSLAELAPPGDVWRAVALDGVQDPGNVGTILRTAAALGASTTLALPGTVDLWNAKVVRSAMGAHFHHPALSCSWDELDDFRDRHRLTLWAADAAGDALDPARAPARLALVVGNEGAGLSAEARARADALAALPIAATVESLNVAVATGILLYALRR
jgi:TrmH family RNA methyltransferase